MTRPSLPANRAADEFARVVDGLAPTDVVERYAPLTRTVTLLREQPTPMPRPEFVTDLRDRLMAAADELPVEAPSGVTPLRPGSHRRSGRRFERHLGAAAAAVVLVGSTAGLAAAAEGSLPGQSLYPVKRGIEQVESAMNVGDAARGEQLLEQADTRLAEVRDLVQGDHGPTTDALITDTLRDFSDSASQGAQLLFTAYQTRHDASSIAAVRDFAAAHLGALDALAEDAPASAAPAFDEAGATLADMDARARVLCGTCSERSPLSLPSSLVDPASAESLTHLVVAPVDRARQQLPGTHRGRAEARAAEKAATKLPDVSPSTPSAKGGTATDLGGTGDPGLKLPLSGNVSGDLQKEPVTGLVHTLTDPLSQQAPGPLGDTLDGVGKTLDGVTKPLDKTVTGLTGGLLGGLTGQSGDSGSSSSQTDGGGLLP